MTLSDLYHLHNKFYRDTIQIHNQNLSGYGIVDGEVVWVGAGNKYTLDVSDVIYRLISDIIDGKYEEFNEYFKMFDNFLETHVDFFGNIHIFMSFNDKPDEIRFMSEKTKIYDFAFMLLYCRSNRADSEIKKRLIDLYIEIYVHRRSMSAGMYYDRISFLEQKNLKFLIRNKSNLDWIDERYLCFL